MLHSTATKTSQSGKIQRPSASVGKSSHTASRAAAARTAEGVGSRSSNGAEGARSNPSPTTSAGQRAAGGTQERPSRSSDSGQRDRLVRSHDAEEPSGSEGTSSLLSGLFDNFGEPEADRAGGAEPKDNTGKEVGNSVQPDPEQQALDSLDRYGDVFDNPGGGDPDGNISRGDLEDVASGEYNRDVARQRLLDRGVSESAVDATLERLEGSAGYLLDNDDLRDSLDTGNDPGGDPDGDISRGDISAELFRRQEELARDGRLKPGEAAPNRDGYEDVDTTNDERSREVIARQEQQILEAVNSRAPIQFTNANGQNEELTLRQVQNTGGNAQYELVGEDGHTIRINSELGATENRTALARIADYYTQLPPGVREGVDEISLLRNPDDEAAADFRSDGDRVRFYDGLQNLNEEVFNHEYGHGIGYENDGLGEGVFDQVGQVFTGSEGEGAPRGWQDAIDSDGRAVSGYSDTNHKEDFAESWAAYLEARENGPEALARLAERYPARYEILDDLYEQAA